MKKILLISTAFCFQQVLFAQPTITSLSPPTGSVGSAVVINGTGFNATPSLNTVYFGATKALVTNASVSALTVSVPFGANNFPLSVLNNGNNLMAFSAQPFRTNFFCPSVMTASSLAAAVSFTGGSNSGITVGDLDGDGKTDMIICMTTSGPNGTVSAFRNISASGTITGTSFATRQDFTVFNPSSVATSDLDGDGKLDIISCSFSSHNVTVLRNTSSPGSISFAPAFTIGLTAGSGPNAIAADDLDMDGKPEIVVADNFPGNISVIKNNSSPAALSFAASIEFTATSQPFNVAIADIDGDGRKDIAAVNSYSGICLYRNLTTPGVINAGSFAQQVHITSTIGPCGLSATDVDGDSKIDLIVSGGLVSAVEVYRNISSSATITTASFAAPVTFTPPGNCYSLMAGDITGDGKADVMVSCVSSSSLSVFQNLSTSGNIMFSAPANYSVGGGNKSQALGDMDNDGRNDVLVTEGINSRVQVFRNLMGLDFAVTTTSVSCNAGTDGQIILSAASLNTLGVLWSNAATTFSLTNLSAGSYNYTLTSGSCVVSQSLNVQQPAPINITASSSSSALCSGQTATLTATGAGTYSWSTGILSPSIAINPSVSTNYIITGTLNGCTNTTSISQNVVSLTLSALSSHSLLCEGSTATLTGSGPPNSTWYNGSTGLSITVNPTVSVNPSVTTVYILSGTLSGCTNTTILVQNVSSVSMTATSLNTLICEGETATLTASGALSYAWTGLGAGTGFTVNPSATTVYTVTGTNADGCAKTLNITQNVSACAGIKSTAANEYVKVFPNPGKGIVFIETDNADRTLSVEIYNTVGQKVSENSLENPQTKLNLELFPSGIYLIKVKKSGELVQALKIIKE